MSELANGELVLYDEERDRAHCLNHIAAIVWQHSNGHRSVADLAAILAQAPDFPGDEHLVWLALEHLAKEHLLREPLTRPADRAGLSRRELLKRLGRTAAVALLVPMVTSISAPPPAMAQNIGGGGGGDGGSVTPRLCCICWYTNENVSCHPISTGSSGEECRVVCEDAAANDRTIAVVEVESCAEDPCNRGVS